MQLDASYPRALPPLPHRTRRSARLAPPPAIAAGPSSTASGPPAARHVASYSFVGSAVAGPQGGGSGVGEGRGVGRTEGERAEARAMGSPSRVGKGSAKGKERQVEEGKQALLQKALRVVHGLQ